MTSPFSTPAWMAAPMATTSDQLRYRRHAGRPTHQDDVVDVALGDAGVGDGPLEGAAAAVEQVGGQLLELGPTERVVEMQRTLVGGRHEGQVDLRGRGLGQLDLGLLGRLLETLHGHGVGGQVHPVVALERRHQPVDHGLVPVVATELGVAGGGLHLEHPVAEFQHRHVERPAAEVEHQDGLVGGLLVESVGEGGRGGLVDDAQHLEPGHLAGLVGGGALGVVEVGGHGDDRLRDGVAEVLLGVALELHQHPGRYLLGGVALVVDLGLLGRPHAPLHRADGAIGVGDGLALGDLAHEHLAVVAERHDGWSGARSLRVGDDDRVAALEDAYDRIRGTEIDTDGLWHGEASFRLCLA